MQTGRSLANRNHQESAGQYQNCRNLRVWQLALRDQRQKPEFFQAGEVRPIRSEHAVAQKSSSKKELKRKRGRARSAPDGKTRTTAPESSATQSASSGPSSSPAKPGGKKRRADLMVIEDGDVVPVEHEPLFGKVVWAQFGGYHSYYPALVIKGSLVNLATPDTDQAFVFWFSDRKVSAVPRDKLLDFVPFFPEKAQQCRGKQGQMGLLKAIEELHRRAEVGGHRLPDMDLLHWAQIGFTVLDNSDQQAFKPGPDFILPESISERLTAIGTEIRQKASQKDKDIPNEFHEESAIAAVRDGSKDLRDVCIACADCDRKVNCKHPLFEGGLCASCKECIQETFYAVGGDGSFSFCTVCGSGGQLFVCDIPSCGRVFCVPCVEELGGENVLNKVQEAKTWSCFLCQPYKPATHGLLKPLPDWQDNLVLFFDMGHRTTVVPDLEYFKTRRPIRVLSLFDGIGTGLLALQKAGIEVEAYYASETDQQATVISQANHGSIIKQIGDVTKITTDMLAEITPIDLLIGGSPCNELSLANPLRKGFDVEGSGVLFFDFYRVLRDLVMLNGTTHLFWMFENVASMRTAFRTVMSRFLQCQPAVWDAKHLSAQKRSRFFWGNIPGLYSTPELSDGLRQEVDLNSVLTQHCHRQANVQCVRTITTQSNSLLQGPEQNQLPVTMAGNQDTLWLSELERLFGFPAHYTDAGNLAPTKRRALLGRSWSVQVVTEILRPLAGYFAIISTAANDVDDGAPRTTTAVSDVNNEREHSAATSNSNTSDLTPSSGKTTTNKDSITTAVSDMNHNSDEGFASHIDTNSSRVISANSITDAESMDIEAASGTTISATSTTSIIESASLSENISTSYPSLNNDDVFMPITAPGSSTSTTAFNEDNASDITLFQTCSRSDATVGCLAGITKSDATSNANCTTTTMNKVSVSNVVSSVSVAAVDQLPSNAAAKKNDNNNGALFKPSVTLASTTAADTVSTNVHASVANAAPLTEKYIYKNPCCKSALTTAAEAATTAFDLNAPVSILHAIEATTTPPEDERAASSKNITDMVGGLADVTDMEVTRVLDSAENADRVNANTLRDRSNVYADTSMGSNAAFSANITPASATFITPVSAPSTTVPNRTAFTSPCDKSAGRGISKDNAMMDRIPQSISDNKTTHTSLTVPATYCSALGTNSCVKWTLAPVKPLVIRPEADDLCSVSNSKSICTENEVVTDSFSDSDDESCQFVAVGVKMNGCLSKQPSRNLFQIYKSAQQNIGNTSVIVADQQDAVQTDENATCYDSKTPEICIVRRESQCHCSHRTHKHKEVIFGSQTSFSTKQGVVSKFQTMQPPSHLSCENNLNQSPERQLKSSYGMNHQVGSSISMEQNIFSNLQFTRPPNNGNNQSQNPERLQAVVKKDSDNGGFDFHPTATSSSDLHSFGPDSSTTCTSFNKNSTAKKSQANCLTLHSNSQSTIFKDPAESLNSTLTVSNSSIVQNHPTYLPACLLNGHEDQNSEYLQVNNGWLVLRKVTGRKMKIETSPKRLCCEIPADPSRSVQGSTGLAQYHMSQEDKLAEGNFSGSPLDRKETHLSDDVNQQSNRFTMFHSDETTAPGLCEDLPRGQVCCLDVATDKNETTEDDRLTNLDITPTAEGNMDHLKLDSSGSPIMLRKNVQEIRRQRKIKVTLEKSSGEKSVEGSSVNSVPHYMTRARTGDRKQPLCSSPTIKVPRSVAAIATASGLTNQGATTSAVVSAAIGLGPSTRISSSQVETKENSCDQISLEKDRSLHQQQNSPTKSFAQIENPSVSQTSRGVELQGKPSSADTMGNSSAEEFLVPFHTTQITNLSVALDNANRPNKSRLNLRKRTRPARCSSNITETLKKNKSSKGNSKMTCTRTRGTRRNSVMTDDTTQLRQRIEMMCLKPPSSLINQSSQKLLDATERPPETRISQTGVYSVQERLGQQRKHREQNRPGSKVKYQKVCVETD